VAVAVIVAVLALPTVSLACFGARPLAMGGAFVAVADDVHATYWNPAGLTKLLTTEVGATFDTDWQALNYDIFAGVATPVGSRAGVGALYVYNEDDLTRPGRRQEDHILQAAFGVVVWPLQPEPSAVTVSFGMAGKYIHRDFVGGNLPEDSTGMGDLDLSLLVDTGPLVAPRHRMFSLGLLVQDILNSSLDFPHQGRETFATNVRPALAFRPDGLTTLALELYDVAEQAGPMGLRVGAERWFAPGSERPWLAVRMGGYHINEERLRAFTFGLGMAVTPRAELSYTLLHWLDCGETTHLIGVGYRFL
jgi:hypothetical protein